MNDVNYIFDLRSIPSDKLEKAGGKASSLSLMMQNLKMRIPSGYVITAEAFRDGKLTDEASEELNQTIAKLDRLKTYAVRSSAIGEDTMVVIATLSATLVRASRTRRAK